MSMQCVFINTEDHPTKICRLGVFRYYINESDLYFQEMCEFFYPHPDAPDYAIVSLYRWVDVTITPGTEYLAKQSIDAMNGLSKITQLA